MEEVKKDTTRSNKEVWNENKELFFEQAVKEFENFSIKKNEKELYRFIMAKVEKPLLEDILNKTRGNKRQAAQILGINRNTLYSKIKKLGIEVIK